MMKSFDNLSSMIAELDDEDEEEQHLDLEYDASIKQSDHTSAQQVIMDDASPELSDPSPANLKIDTDDESSLEQIDSVNTVVDPPSDEVLVKPATRSVPLSIAKSSVNGLAGPHLDQLSPNSDIVSNVIVAQPQRAVGDSSSSPDLTKIISLSKDPLLLPDEQLIINTAPNILAFVPCNMPASRDKMLGRLKKPPDKYVLQALCNVSFGFLMPLLQSDSFDATLPLSQLIETNGTTTLNLVLSPNSAVERQEGWWDLESKGRYKVRE
jgi:hypothetical protein